MRKHFLMLLWMALLPLAGWAQTNLNGYTITFDPDAEFKTYTGLDLKPTIVLTKDLSPNIEEEDLIITWRKNGTVVTEIKEVGEYVVTVEANTSETYGNLEAPTKSFWVLKANNEVDVKPSLLNAAQDWTAAGYDLVTNAATVHATFGDVKYLVTDNATVPAADAEGWTTDAPHKSNAGTYYVYYKVDGNTNYKAVAPAAAINTSVTINGQAIPAVWGAPTAVTGLKYINDDQELINAGTGLSTTYGKFMYKLSTSETWSENIPTGKNGGNYTVNWKIAGNERYAGNPGGDIAVTIDANDPNVQAAAIEGLTYTGKAQSLITVTTAYGAAPQYTIQYRANTTDEWGAAGAPITDIANVKATNAGFYKITATVAASANFSADEAVVTDAAIAKAPLTVSTKATTKVYGQADPTLERVYTGFVNNETKTVLTTEPTIARDKAGTADGEKVGPYLISLTQNGAAANYTFVYDEDNYKNLTITPKDLNDATDGMFTVTVATGDLTYNGEAQTKDFTIQYTGAAVVSCKTMNTPADYAFVYANNKNAGTAQIIITGQGNFTGSRIATYAIGKKDIYIKPNNRDKTYGAADPDRLDGVAEATTDDYKLGTLAGTVFTEDEEAELKGKVILAREPGENVSSYKIYVKNYEAAADDNYAVTNVLNEPTSANPANITGVFQIKADGEGLVLTLTQDAIDSKTSMYYGDEKPTYTINDLKVVSGLVNNDKWEDIKTELITPSFNIEPKWDDVAHNAENVLVLTGLASTNYPKVTLQSQSFTVNPRPVAVLVKSQTINYGASLEQDQDAAHWVVVDANSHGGDWNGNKNTDELYTTLQVTFSTTNALAEYGPKDTPWENVIEATSKNANYIIDVTDNSTWGNLTVNATGLVLLSSDDDAFTKIKANDGKTVNVQINFNGRTRKVVNEDDEVTDANPWHIWAANKWNTLVLPFEISVAELSNKLGYADNIDDFNYVVVNTIKKGADAGKFQFQYFTGTIPANTPFMVKTVGDITAAPATAAIDGIIDFGLKTIEAPEYADVAAEFDNGFKLVGEYTHFKLDKTTTARDAQGNALYKFLYGDDDSDYNFFGASSKNSWTIVSFDGYVDLSGDPLHAHEVVFEFEDPNGNTTAIKSVSADDANVKAEGWYTINGVKLQNAPSQKGIYIFNGKKLVVK